METSCKENFAALFDDSSALTGSKDVRLFKILAGFVFGQIYIWSNADIFVEGYGNLCNVADINSTQFRANRIFHTVAFYWYQRLVWKYYVEDAYSLKIHL